MNQAEIFVEHAESKGEVYDPGEDFQPPSATVGSIFQIPKSPAAATASYRYKKACNYHFRDKSKDPRPDFGPNIDHKAA